MRYTYRFVFLMLLVISFHVTACKNNGMICPQNRDMARAISKVWVKDTCGQVEGDRASIAKIYSYYLNDSRPGIKLKELEAVLGKPDEIREISNGITHRYYYIGRKNCPGKLKSSVFVLQVISKKHSRRILGSSLHIYEPEDN